MFHLSKRSLERLEGVHPDLVRVVKKAITYTKVDFTVLEGVRSLDRQKKLYNTGASKTLNSRHLAKVPRYQDEIGAVGHAVDLGAYVDGEIRWDWPLYYKLYDAMRMASVEEGVPIRWGGDWDMDGEYNDEKWRDGPHFELPRRDYPV